nr:protein IQ-DOMAIN 1-like [Ipomoea batatas]
MGVSGKWIRSLIGLKRPEKSLATEKGENLKISNKYLQLRLLLVHLHAHNQLEDAAQIQQSVREERAAIRIQKQLFRGFLFKLVSEQKRVRMALESQTAHQKLQQQLENEARVREIEEGWCDSIGSVEQIQAKLLKRQEAAAKRERGQWLMLWLTSESVSFMLQWQAGSKQHTTPAGFEPDKSSWGGTGWRDGWGCPSMGESLSGHEY